MSENRALTRLSEEPSPKNVVDFFIEENGVCFAGRHFLVDMWGAGGLEDTRFIEKTLREAAEAAGARVLHGHFHTFSPNNGVSGVLVLAESHISIHTWPERAYAALDIFMCGNSHPERAIPTLERAFRPEKMTVERHRRGAAS